MMDVVNETSEHPAEAPPVISKSQQKKLKRLEKKLERRKESRAQEKARRKERRRELKDQGLGELLRKKRHTKMADSSCKLRLVVDMGYETLMTENLIRNTIAQLSFCYAANRHRDNPMQFYITQMAGRSLNIFHQVEGTKNWDVYVREESLDNIFDRESVVYLSSDSDNVLEALDEEKVYVIGGLLDHNQHPGASLRRAEENGWKHAKLPIGEFIKMNSRKVLTINHVFEILLHFYDTHNWEDAFFNVIPKRKGAERVDGDVKSKTEGKPTEKEGNEPATNVSLPDTSTEPLC